MNVAVAGNNDGRRVVAKRNHTGMKHVHNYGGGVDLGAR
jgi:hypothetical protein